MANGDDDLLTLAQVAAMLNVSPATVKRFVRSGELPIVRFGYHTIRCRRGDVDAFIVAHRTPPAAGGQ